MLDVTRIRNVAVARIRPLVDASRHRFDDIPNSIWLEPYMVGLIGMLITLAAQHERQTIEQSALRRVQSEAWREITGLDYRIGEEIMLLSSSHDVEFLEGCMDASRIASELFHYSSGGFDPIASSACSEPFTSHEIADFVQWRDTFDSYVARRR